MAGRGDTCRVRGFYFLDAMPNELRRSATNESAKVFSGRAGTWHFLSVVAGAVGFALCLAALLFVALRVFPALARVPSLGVMPFLESIRQSLSAWVRGNLAPFLGGVTWTPWIVVALTFACGWLLRAMSQKLHDRAENLRFQSSYQEWRAQVNLPGNAEVLRPMRRMEDMQDVSRSDREELLKTFAQIKKKLDETGRDLAFLSIDVVDSTGMKRGEERASIEHDFRMYKMHVEKALAAHNCLKSTWTPDGVMGCFDDVDAAIGAARAIVTGLDEFNGLVKTMKREFQVRCGVNSGYVYFDEAQPLEELSDRVLDVAGHLQKNAEPCTICVAQPAIEPTLSRDGFTASGKIVDGYQVYEWRPNNGEG